ncbi:MAG: hypothetical protein ACRD4O_01605, partial [Bryobacteraceae bacterium]
YSGVIITGSIHDDKCQELVFDNRNRTMLDEGTISCDSVLPELQDDHSTATSNAARFEEVGKAFRHEGD